MDWESLPSRSKREVRAIFLLLSLPILGMVSCQTSPPPAPDPEREIVDEGRRIFFTETFDGNGRTCGTCHRAEDNFALSPAFIATLPDDDPLFVAERVPELHGESVAGPA